MNEPISLQHMSGIKHLTSKSVVSLEMALPSQELHISETAVKLKEIEMDLVKTERLLLEMTNIRGAIEHSLNHLNFVS